MSLMRQRLLPPGMVKLEKYFTLLKGSMHCTSVHIVSM